jgi:hypothetical protein
LPLGAAACGGASFDDPSVVKGLRVLAVQKNPPYPKPGEDVDIKLVFWDGKSTEDNPRDVTVEFSPMRCENPKGDLYYNCFAGLGSAALASDFVPAAAPSTPLPLQDIDHIRETTVPISGTIISGRPPPPPGVPPYGLSYVLFTACAGHLGPVVGAGPNTLPLGCFDNADNHQLGADDFVIGYTAIYVYDERINNNPVINDFLFATGSLKDSTTDDTLVLHIPSCTASDRESCPKYAVKLALDKATTVDRDDDPTAVRPDGQPLDEQVWAAYYVTAGEVKSSLRLVNDATAGWNESNGTEFTAPAEPGPVRFFAVLHDNRGGVAWAEGKIIVD